MRVSFLKSSHNIRATKTFSPKGNRSYPSIATFDSQSFEVEKSLEGLKYKTQLCKDAAADGACMLKGYVTDDFKQSRRSGKVDREALTENLILDIDGVLLDNVTVNTPIDQVQLRTIAEQAVMHLPGPFRGVSYIVHASSSMGMKGQQICLHIDFALQDPAVPTLLKEYVVYLNHSIPVFNDSFTLAASSTALRYPLDRTVVDNSHLIYLGHPQFEGGLVDPIPDPSDRIFLVEKSGTTVNLSADLREHADSEKNRRATDRKINELRHLEGLPKRSEKTNRLTVNGQTYHVVTNPEALKMTLAADNGDFVSYNVNGGDSAGYYVQKYRPTIVHNFKGEPTFLFEAADPETYQWHLETFIGAMDPTDPKTVDSRRPQLPLVFRDEATNAYFNALLDTGTGQVARIAKASREGLADWMTQYEGVMPDNVPIWNYEFDPHRTDIVNFKERFINKYLPSPLMVGEMPEGFLPLTYDTGHMLYQDCPRIAELILHSLGNSIECFNHFLNWLAAALQTKDKLGTAWILQGTQGTGKGVLYERILSPLVGTGISQDQAYAAKIRLENIEDQFNQWQECALFVVLDEFRLSDSPRAQKLFNKIKSMITETHEPIRGIRENMRMVRSYSNYLFFSNDQDVMYLPDDDRRFNVADRQEIKIDELWSNKEYIIEYVIGQELPLFAKHMQYYLTDVAKAKTVLNTAAKREMRETSRTTVEDFIHAIRLGDLEFFLPILDMPYQMPGAGYVLPAQTLMKEFLRDFDLKQQKVTIESLRILYVAYVGPSENSTKFAKMLSKYGLHSSRMKFGNTVKRGYLIDWHLRDNSIESLRTQYLDQIDYQFGQNAMPDNKVVNIGRE